MGEAALQPTTVTERLEQVLRGRSAWKWAESVHLSSGALSRMLKGQFPDPEKLVPACRIENLSLTWLIEGRGTPFSVACPASDEEAAEVAQMALQDDPAADVLVCYCNAGYTLIVHAPVYAQTSTGKPYEYKATTIVGGCAAGYQVAEWLRHITHLKRFHKKHRAAQIAEPEWHRLASGYMGNFEIFGDTGAGGLYGDATHGHLPDLVQRFDAPMYSRRAVRDDDAVPWTDPREREQLAILRELSDTDRDAATRMLRGLQKPRDP